MAVVSEACGDSSPWQHAPLMHGIAMGTAAAPLPTLVADIATFLVMRGPFAYTGARGAARRVRM